ncbi:MAG: anaerobic ribonucleoside triphosphate reductase, partial [Selenomonadaceae bacterium]|nr:anaerobic ribonucleoside triphosphate reductase [Selenomonadaceae bacterium]
MQIIKRDGTAVDFRKEKIYNALRKCRDAVCPQLKAKVLLDIAVRVAKKVREFDDVHVEDVQDAVEFELMDAKLFAMAKAYIEYRHLHKIRRDGLNDLMSTCREILFADSAGVDSKRSNANINSDAPMGMMLNLGAETAKFFNNTCVLPPEFADAHREKFIHIHDQDFSMITLNCCQIDTAKLLANGFSTGHGFVREPQSIRSAAALAAIAVQSNQNDMFGGQSLNGFDFAMAKYVTLSFAKAFLKEINHFCLYAGDAVPQPFITPAFAYGRELTLRNLMKAGVDPSSAALIYRNACREVEDETHQAMEALIHNFNTLHSRAGAQVPFSSLNYGMDTSPEGRLVTRELLNAIEAGLGHGETAIFPISVFQIKRGVNFDEGDPNCDLFKRACEVSAKRLFPNFLNLDAPYNLQYYKPDDYNSFVATMGCRTRVMSNVNGAEVSSGRGNFAFVTINLPKLALEAHGDTKRFFELFDEYIDICRDYLKFRLKFIAEKHVYNFPFLMGQGVWLDSDKLKPTDKIGDVLKHASYSIGFCGLAEALKFLTGSHHGESDKAQSL